MSVLTLGVDVSLKSLDAALCSADGRAVSLGTFPNDEAGFQRLAQAVQAQQAAGDTVHLVMEPTGGYEQPLARYAGSQNWVISLPNPRQVREWIHGIGKRAKTDRQDALLLARYGAEHELPIWQPLPEAVQILDGLLGRREDLAGMLRQENNRRQALQAQGRYQGAVATNLEQTIARLEQSLAEIEAEIKKHLKSHPDLQQDVRRLRSVPGVGLRNVLPLLVQLHRWRVLTANKGDGRSLTAFLGLDPQPFDSGTSVHRVARISHAGNRKLRSLLFLGALGGVRGHNVLREFYQRLVASHHGRKMQALIAAARKILIWAWAVFRDETTFQPMRARP